MPDYLTEQSIGGRVAGIDEVGRGPLAGPVVACAVWLNPDEVDGVLLSQLNDSKLIPKRRREALSQELISLPAAHLRYSIGLASVAEIDRVNILQATMLAMQRAYDGISSAVDSIIVDGNKVPSVSCPALAIVGGDRKSLSIAAASIIAKVHRDSLMELLSKQFPEYGWDRNAGYGTKEHLAAIDKFGLTEHHRRSFCKRFL
ncbi:MAG: ribonuclease HII [Holosporales bacterium]|jgi:ribonuclease HII|nr:ribonuclease HII [Holosporales bacterium]